MYILDSLATTLLIILIIFYLFYCLARIADFKSRNNVKWALLALLGFAPAYITLSLMPSLRPKEEQEAYNEKFTDRYSKAGNIICALILFAILILLYMAIDILFYYSYYPLVPSMIDRWLEVHVLLYLLACVATIASFVLSVLRAIKNAPFIRVILNLQLLTVSLIYLVIISGAIWASRAWGAYWSSDIKELWSLCLLAIIAEIHSCFIRTVPTRWKALALILLQIAALTFHFRLIRG